MRVIVRNKKGMMVNRVICENESFSIGSNADAIVALNGWKIASNHAIVNKRQNKIFVQDLGSQTGTFVDGARVVDTFGLLVAGQQIGVGDYLIEIVDIPTFGVSESPRS